MRKRILSVLLCSILSFTFLLNSTISIFASVDGNNVSEKVISEKDLQNIINELNSIQWDNGIDDDSIDERGAASTLIKKVAKWCIKNLDNLTKVILKYAPSWTFGKAFTDHLEDVAEGISSFDDSIDEFFLDLAGIIAPNLDYKTQKGLANALRFVCPF